MSSRNNDVYKVRKNLGIKKPDYDFKLNGINTNVNPMKRKCVFLRNRAQQRYVLKMN